MSWPKHPVIYEINTWVWLHELSQRLGRPVTLGSVPAETWDALGGLHADAVWLMGVWERSPIGLGIARTHQGLQIDFRRALPDYAPTDNVGSPYCIRRYAVDVHLGGPDGLAAARKELAVRGLRLMLDFVPNHVAPDHPWVAAHPEYFIRGTVEDLARAPGDFFEADGAVFACGRDPYFPPWQDVLQLNAFSPALRQAVVRTLHEIADQCDGVRCDMAMLLINRVFEQTWDARAGQAPAAEYWREVIAAVRAQPPRVPVHGRGVLGPGVGASAAGLRLLLRQAAVRQIGARLRRADPAPPCGRPRLSGEAGSLHRESRRAPGGRDLSRSEKRGPRRPRSSRCRARNCSTRGNSTVGASSSPSSSARRPAEPADADLQEFYARLLRAIRTPALRAGEWRLCERSGWPDNQSCLNLVAWCWRAGGRAASDRRQSIGGSRHRV